MTTLGEYLEQTVRPQNTADIPSVQLLKELLESDQRVIGVRKVGSSQRKTWISPINDVDLFVVLEPTVLYEHSLVALKDVLRQIVKAQLECAGEEHVDEHTVRLSQSTLGTNAQLFEQSMLLRTQNASLGLAFDCEKWSDAKITVDLVPAIELTRDRYMICKDTKPLLSHPKAMENVTAALQKQNDKFIDLVRLAKKWNSLHNKPFKSFHIEVMCQRIVKSKQWSWNTDLATNFSRLLEQMADVCSTQFRVPGVAGKCVGLDLETSDGIKTLRKDLRRDAKMVLSDWKSVFQ